ncbi:hypothetical protein, partial [Escherichia coli]
MLMRQGESPEKNVIMWGGLSVFLRTTIHCDQRRGFEKYFSARSKPIRLIFMTDFSTRELGTSQSGTLMP